MTPEIIPSILVESASEFERRLRLVENHVTTVHVDVLDGTLFPHISWHDAIAIGAMKTPVKYELHLMVENPLPIIEAWQLNVEGFMRAIVHAEMHRPLATVIDRIRSMKLEAGVALNPETPLSAMHEVAHIIDQLVIMGVHPGASGQSFLGDSVLEKIREARTHRIDLPIEIDGGVTETLVKPCVQAGATRFCAASLLYSAPNPLASLETIKSLLSTAA